jgi:hypothetical protein
LYRLAFNVIDGGGTGVAIAGSLLSGPLDSLLSRLGAGPALAIAVLFLFAVCDVLLLLCARAHRSDPGSVSMPKDVSNDDDPELPFPGEYGPGGFETQHIRLYVYASGSGLRVLNQIQEGTY